MPQPRTVVLRQLFGGRIWGASPALAVEERPERLVLWLPPGVVTKRAAGDLFTGWRLEDRVVSRTNGILRVKEPDEDYAILHFWHDDGSFAGWYVNLESPFAATALGWDYEDHLLDVWLEAGGEARWLDEDELARAVELELMTDAQARAARAAGERALARLLAAEAPARTGWEDWRPDAAWRLPNLPRGWDASPRSPGAVR